MNTQNDDQLRNTRDKLLARGSELRDRLQRVNLDLKREREPLPRDSADAAIVLENDEVLQAIQSSAQGELARIELALQRLEDGTFALCEKCGAEIDAARLQAVPYTSLCRDCAHDA
jgi:RNA polymerase-binding transcription factor DksA